MFRDQFEHFIQMRSRRRDRIENRPAAFRAVVDLQDIGDEIRPKDCQTTIGTLVASWIAGIRSGRKSNISCGLTRIDCVPSMLSVR